MTRRFLLLALTITVCLAGCPAREEITTYTVPKELSGLDMLDRRPPIMSRLNNSPKIQTSPHRIVVAIASRENATWFFKVAGPPENVATAESEWRSFLTKIKFDENGIPQYELPEGWKSLGGTQFRFASLQIGDFEPRLEMAISELSGSQDLVDNVNRWRVDQLSLAAVTEENLNLGTIETEAGEFLLFDETGSGGSSSMTGMMPTATVPSPVAEVAETKFKYELGDDWKDQTSVSMVKLKRIKTVDDQQAQISVTQLGSAADQWEPNVQTWASAIGISGMSAPEFLVRTTEIKVDGYPAKRVRLIEPDDQYTAATIAIMFTKDDSTWFIKLTGDKSLVESVENEFDAFVASFAFESDAAENEN